MVPLASLWLPILLSAVIVFVASSLMHMVLKYHQSDYRQLPDEDKILAALRPAGLRRGLYIFPFCTHKDMKSPALIEKYKQGPVGFLTILPNGPPAMPKFLIQWFVFAEVPDPVVCLLSASRILCCVSRGTHADAGNGLSGRISRCGDSRVSRLRSRKPQQRHLERSDLVGNN